jgi:hypothetical protein
MIGPENFWWSEENYCDSSHLRGKIDGFLRDGNRAIINRNTNGPGSRCDICVQNCRPIVGSAVSAGPSRPAAPTDSDDFFSWSGPHLPPRGPTWIRPWLVAMRDIVGENKSKEISASLIVSHPCWCRIITARGTSSTQTDL